MMRLVDLLVFVAVAPITNILCDLVYAAQTNNCAYFEAKGNAVFCCSGSCLDGTYIDQPGICLNWADPCLDLSTPPTCSSSQVIVQGLSPNWIASGDGGCWFGNDCEWQRNNWTWSCCDCPAGFVNTGGGVCNPPTSQRCVQCSDSSETLTSYFQCVVSQGLSCDLVDNLATQFSITSQAAPDTNGYYGQLLNLACLRSACPNPACNNVRRFAGTNTACTSLSGSFVFEQYVFSQFATPPNRAQLTQFAGQIQQEAEAISATLAGTALLLSAAELVAPPLAVGLGVLSIIAALGSTFGDPQTLGASIAGYKHFQNDLQPDFQKYINNLAASATDQADLDAKFKALTVEHESLLNCAVQPGFEAEKANGDLPPLSTFFAELIVPWQARSLRDNFMVNAAKARGLTAPNKRQVGPDQATEDLFIYLGAVLPTTPSLRSNLRNWFSFPYDSGPQYYDFSAYSAAIELTGLGAATLDISYYTGFILSTPPRDATLDPFVVRVTTFYPGMDDGYTPFQSQWHGNNISIVGTIVSILDAAAEVIMLNSTHVLGAAFDDPPVPFDPILAQWQAQTQLVVPANDEPAVLYRTANITLSYFQPSSSFPDASAAGSYMTIFDLVSGLPLTNVTYSQTSYLTGNFEATISPGDGIWGGLWKGGCMFALGLQINGIGEVTSSSISSTSSPSTSLILSTSSSSSSSSSTSSLNPSSPSISLASTFSSSISSPSTSSTSSTSLASTTPSVATLMSSASLLSTLSSTTSRSSTTSMPISSKTSSTKSTSSTYSISSSGSKSSTTSTSRSTSASHSSPSTNFRSTTTSSATSKGISSTSRSSTSTPTPSSRTSSTLPVTAISVTQKCMANNCLNAVRHKSSSAITDCSSFQARFSTTPTLTKQTAVTTTSVLTKITTAGLSTAGIPTYASACSGAVNFASACTCIGVF